MNHIRETRLEISTKAAIAVPRTKRWSAVAGAVVERAALMFGGALGGCSTIWFDDTLSVHPAAMRLAGSCVDANEPLIDCAVSSVCGVCACSKFAPSDSTTSAPATCTVPARTIRSMSKSC